MKTIHMAGTLKMIRKPKPTKPRILCFLDDLESTILLQEADLLLNNDGMTFHIAEKDLQDFFSLVTKYQLDWNWDMTSLQKRNTHAIRIKEPDTH